MSDFLSGIFPVYTMQVDGLMYATNPLNITRTAYERSRSLTIGTTGEIHLDMDGRSQGKWIDVSYIGAHGVDIAGKLFVGLFSNIYPTMQGWDYLEMTNSGEFRFDPATDFICDSIKILDSAIMEVFNPVFLHGNMDNKISHLIIRGQLLLDTSQGSWEVWRNVSSELHVDEVVVDGTFHAGRLNLDKGWDSVTVGGSGFFTLQTGDFPVDRIGVASPSGRMTFLEPVYVHGHNGSHVQDMNIGKI